MLRLALLLIFCLPLAAFAQVVNPKIDLSAGASSGSGGAQGQGTASVSGTIELPPGWKLSIHVVTVRYALQGGSTSLNALIPIQGKSFSNRLDLKNGSYKVWAVIDVKDADGRERQISSAPQNVNIQ